MGTTFLDIMSASDLNAVVARLEAVAPADDGDVPRFVEEYDVLIEEHINPFVAAAKTIGGAIEEAANHFADAVRAQREFLVVVGTCKKPADDVFASLLGPTATALGAAINIRETVARSDDAFNALSAISEGAPGLGWVQTTKPAPHAKSMGEAAEFYLNRVLKDHKETTTRRLSARSRRFGLRWP